jgi:hypothetical protein
MLSAQVNVVQEARVARQARGASSEWHEKHVAQEASETRSTLRNVPPGERFRAAESTPANVLCKRHQLSALPRSHFEHGEGEVGWVVN